MNNLHRTLFVIILFSLLGIVSSAKAITVEYLDEMHDEDTTSNQIKSKMKIDKYCNSLKRYGYTDADVRGCIGEKSKYYRREKLRIEAKKSCFIKYAGSYQKVASCVQARYREIRRVR